MAHLQDWIHLLFRWAHIFFGAAWIGTSFYFVFLNNAVRPPREPEEGDNDRLEGELHAIHGGGFYHVRKYKVAPAQLPEELHWFKYEAYFTWLTGFALLVVVYYLNAAAFMVDPSVADLPAWAAVAIGLGTLVVGWGVYDGLCRSPLAKKPVAFSFFCFFLACAAAFGLSQVLAPRAAYIHVGALLGTCMAGNVLMVIIPNQRRMVEAMKSGGSPDPAHGKAGALRSLHNNYMTMPVLFIMVSNHFPFTFGNGWNWAILAGLALSSGFVNHWRNLQEKGVSQPILIPIGVAGIIALALVTRPPSLEPVEIEGGVSFAQVQGVIATRCTPCHSAQSTHPAFPTAPKGVMFDTPEQIMAQVDAIKKQSVDSQIMPLGNLTKMTPEERGLLAAWMAAGTPQ